MINLDAQRTHTEFPRHFVAEDADLGDWTTLEKYFEELQARPVDEPSQLERWLTDLSEVSAAISEESAARYIAMTCQTDDPALEKAYLHYVEHILPQTEPRFFELSKKYLASPARQQLSKDRFFVFDRARENEVALFREENIPLQTQDDVLRQQYQKTCGEQTVEFDGREQTLPQLAKYLEETDRAKRKAAWNASVVRQLQDREKMEDFFEQMLELRGKIAAISGFDNYLEYMFRRLGRFDYSPLDCRKFQEAIERDVMPVRRKLRERRKAELGLEKLAPWDLDVDPQGRPPLRPFNDAQELIEGADRIFDAVSPLLSKDFDVLKSRNLLDLDSRKAKAPGGYQSTLDEARLPFIFMNAAGRNQDVFTLLHEGGHAFHALAHRYEPLHAYRDAPIEFCEVASMGMEMMACERLTSFYKPEEAQRARTMHLQDTIILLPWIARIDAFQHWIYTHPSHTREERKQQWLELDARFGDDLDWSEHPEWRECSWIRQLHLFCVPLYYVEYGIAQLGALQLWVNYLRDQQATIDRYRSALALGSSKPLPQLFEAAGIRFAFDSQTIGPLMEKVSSELVA
ncbi:MAG: M3 family oligoendopeptidase [Candidatus Sumerlaeaceae bacterium]